MELRSATGLNSNSGLRMDSALNIAVISDTHDNVPENLISAIESADEIWHLGDICQLESLQRLRSLGPSFCPCKAIAIHMNNLHIPSF